MKTPSFFEGVGIAFISALGGSILFAFLPNITGTLVALKLMISIITLGYLWYLLKRSPERIGRLTIIAAWFVATLLIWFWSPSFIIYCLFNAAMIWLVRSLYFYNGIFIALTDLLLTLFGFAAANWAMINTQSLFISIWCFFLVQALFPALTTLWKNRSNQTTQTAHNADTFGNALKIAESAVRKLSSNSSL